MVDTAPGPGLAVVARLSRLRRDPLGTMLAYHAEYGDIVRLGDGAFTVHLLGHPDHADHVLRRRHANYDRRTRSADAVRLVTGESLLTNDGDEWRRHRLLMQPLFREDALRSLASIVLEVTNARIDRWLEAGEEPARQNENVRRVAPLEAVTRESAPRVPRGEATSAVARGGEIDLAAEMCAITSTVAARAFFGTDVDEDLARLMPVILEETYARSTAIFPTGGPSSKFEHAIDEVRATVERILARGDSPLLAQLRELSPVELRNETIALLLAGHETTANALAWTFVLLSRAAAPDAAASAAGTAALHAVQEAMRLYPPVWIVERRAVDDDEIGGIAIPAGTIVYVSPYVLHRHRDFWSDPERFDPSRFPDAARNPAYLPFGAGPHSCLGAAFAMIEAPLVIATVRERCTIAIQGRVEPQAWVTLRPRRLTAQVSKR